MSDYIATWQRYRYKLNNISTPLVVESRPYKLGEPLVNIAISYLDDPPADLGMIVRKISNHAIQWYINRRRFLACYELITTDPKEDVNAQR